MAKSRMSYAARTKSWLEEQGYTIGTVERRIHPGSFVSAGFTKDLFGCIDQIAIRTGEVAAVQTCGQDWAPHWKKLLSGSGRDGLVAWMLTTSPFLLIGWRKLGGAWAPRVHWFLMEDVLQGCDSQRHRSYEEWMSRTP